MQKGQTGILILVGILIIGLVAGGAYYLGRQTTPKSSPAPVISQTPQPSPTSDVSPAPTGAGETANWKTYTSTTANFSIKYPPEWNLKENTSNKSDLPKFSVTMVPPLRPDIEFPPVIGVKVYDNSNNITLENFVKKQNPFNFQATTVTVSEVTGIKISLPGGTNNDHIFLSFNGNIYDISLDHSVKKEDDIKPEIFNQILSTFKFTK